MEESFKESFKKALEDRYHRNVIEKNNIFVVKNAGTATSPFIPEELNQIINNMGTAYDLRKGQLAYTIYKGDLIIQYSP